MNLKQTIIKIFTNGGASRGNVPPSAILTPYQTVTTKRKPGITGQYTNSAARGRCTVG